LTDGENHKKIEYLLARPGGNWNSSSQLVMITRKDSMCVQREDTELEFLRWVRVTESGHREVTVTVSAIFFYLGLLRLNALACQWGKPTATREHELVMITRQDSMYVHV
jgi:hypothetical protein